MRRSVLLAVWLLASPAWAEAPTLRVGLQALQPGTLDPHRATTTEDVTLVGWMFEGLLRFPPGSADPGKLEPDLAEHYTQSPDGLTWVFSLRPGVTSQDGAALTARDVATSLLRAADPKTSAYAGDYADVAAVDVIDPLTVRIVLRRVVPSLPGLVANYHGGMIVAANNADPAHPLGTGPFRYASTGAGGVELTANPAYRRGAPRLAGISAKYMPSDQTRELALTTGELDLIVGRREQRWVQRLREVPGLAVDVFAPGEFRTLLLNTTAPPLDDIRVRRAVEYAIDVPAIIRFVGADVAKRGVSPVPPGYLGATTEISGYAPDPAKARALLAEAGHKDGITLHAIVSSISAQLSVMEVVQAQLKRAGITLVMDVVDHATYHQRIRQDLSQLVFYGAARFPVADSYLTQMYLSRSAPGQPTASLNFAHCAVADSEIDGARSEADPSRQLAMWATAQAKIMEAACAVPLFDLLQVWARTNRLDYGYRLEGALNLAPPITEATSLRPR